MAHYWLNTKKDEAFDVRSAVINDLYGRAVELADNGEIVVSNDEMTGVQAKEHKFPQKPTMPGSPRLIEHEYIRHGTLSFIVMVLVNSHPEIKRWHIVADNLNTHCSESVVRFVAAESDLDIDLGKKGVSGILKSMKSRAEFLNNPDHRVVFYYTPKHAS